MLAAYRALTSALQIQDRKGKTVDQDSREETYIVTGHDEQLGKFLPALAGLVCHGDILQFSLVMTGQKMTLRITFDKPTDGRHAEIEKELAILGKLRETGCIVR
jgi:hypothetical protein